MDANGLDPLSGTLPLPDPRSSFPLVVGLRSVPLPNPRPSGDRTPVEPPTVLGRYPLPGTPGNAKEPPSYG